MAAKMARGTPRAAQSAACHLLLLGLGVLGVQHCWPCHGDCWRNPRLQENLCRCVGWHSCATLQMVGHEPPRPSAEPVFRRRANYGSGSDQHLWCHHWGHALFPRAHSGPHVVKPAVPLPPSSRGLVHGVLRSLLPEHDPRDSASVPGEHVCRVPRDGGGCPWWSDHQGLWQHAAGSQPMPAEPGNLAARELHQDFTGALGGLAHGDGRFRVEHLQPAIPRAAVLQGSESAECCLGWLFHRLQLRARRHHPAVRDEFLRHGDAADFSRASRRVCCRGEEVPAATRSCQQPAPRSFGGAAGRRLQAWLEVDRRGGDLPGGSSPVAGSRQRRVSFRRGDRRDGPHGCWEDVAAACHHAACPLQGQHAVGWPSPGRLGARSDQEAPRGHRPAAAGALLRKSAVEPGS
mmetsp:Transcript_71594/g.128893  ORF Transcript_71594/g.128893 Transcript_71594/m.128893 type:complete len:404 (-) Transcript_71594:135-1346(-)